MIEEGEIVGAEIWDSEGEQGPSDHCPISVDIRLSGGKGTNLVAWR